MDSIRNSCDVFMNILCFIFYSPKFSKSIFVDSKNTHMCVLSPLFIHIIMMDWWWWTGESGGVWWMPGGGWDHRHSLVAVNLVYWDYLETTCTSTSAIPSTTTSTTPSTTPWYFMHHSLVAVNLVKRMFQGTSTLTPWIPILQYSGRQVNIHF